ncbi:MAG TPA: hypothetical protein VNI84_01765 [Pyrinomonadaceae bacterium]|nr:hypothetical protein [Pyrinomonadaceae bacterium]
MFCPRCSQQQISEEIKFCSRCGLPLGVVAEVVAHDGFLPQLAELGKKRKIFTRRNGLIFTLFWFMFFVLILTPIFGVADIDELAAVAALFGTMGGLILLVASFIFLKNEPKTFAAPVQNADAPNNVKNLYRKNQNALPALQSIPASTFVPPTQGNWRDTKDLVQPSVTEGTTKLLGKDE